MRLRGVAAGCLLAIGPASAAAQASSEDATLIEMRRAIVAWMHCIECNHAELDSVLRFDGTAVPTLAAILRQGPSAVELEVRRAELARDYDKLAAFKARRKEDLSMKREDYVSRELARYGARHRLRAAHALSAIGGDEALAAVRRAMEASNDQGFRERLGRLLVQPRK